MSTKIVKIIHKKENWIFAPRFDPQNLEDLYGISTIIYVVTKQL